MQKQPSDSSAEPGPPEPDLASLYGPVGRIVDANLNRSAEALRVVEEICRLHWNLPGLCGELKALRHSLLGAFFPQSRKRIELVRFRDIEGDPGTQIASPADRPCRESAPTRGSERPEAVTAASLERAAVRNLERLKESLRTLEEVCREETPRIAKKVESFRYQVYCIEKAVIKLASGTPSPLDDVHLYLLWTESCVRGPADEILAGALQGGVDAVQMREKDLSDRQRLKVGRRLREITARRDAQFIVNDRPDIARLLHADGVHLGQNDLPAADARRIVGDSVMIGVSTHSLEQARQAVREGADYIGIGPVFRSVTKDAGPLLGPENFQKIYREVTIPAFAIGGIDSENIEGLIAVGATRVALSSAILKAKNSGEAQRIAAEIRATLV